MRFLAPRTDKTSTDAAAATRHRRRPHSRRLVTWVAICGTLVFTAFLARGPLDDWVNHRSDARVVLCKATGRSIALAIALYMEDHGTPPPLIGALVPEYFPQLPVDSWKRPFGYVVNTDGTATLSTLGADGKPGGAGSSADRWWEVTGPGQLYDGSGTPPPHPARTHSERGGGARGG